MSQYLFGVFGICIRRLILILAVLAGLSVGVQRLSAAALLVYSDNSDWVNDVKSKIEATAVLDAPLTLFDAGAVTPSLRTLQLYDCVLVWSNFAFDDAIVLGDNLADYVDGGGGVVVMTFANAGESLDIDGRWEAGGYDPITPLSQTQNTQLTLGAKQQPSHPVLAHVQSFDGGSSSFHGTGALAPDASLIAQWSNADPLIAELTNKAGRIVALNFFPPSSDQRSDFWDSSTDGGLLMANALSYVCCGGVTSLPVNPYHPDGADSILSDTTLSWNDRGGCIVAPNRGATENLAPGNSIPFGQAATFRWQQIYHADQFTHGGTISELRFRLSRDFGTAFGPVNYDMQISLGYATQSPATASATFTDNIGAGYTTVYDGALSLSSTDGGAPLRDFDIVIDVDDGFVYDPTRGHLLLDIRKRDTVSSGTFFSSDVTTGKVARIFAADVDAVDGTAVASSALVTQFCFESAPAIINPSAAGFAEAFSSSQEITLPSIDRGWYRQDGLHTAANDNTYTGRLSTNILNSFFVFDLPIDPVRVLGARLDLTLQTYFGSDLVEKISFWDVTTSIAALRAGGQGLVSIFNDLESGRFYASRSFLPAEEGLLTSSPLNALAVTDISLAGSGLFAVGGHCETVDTLTESEAIRFNAGGSSEPTHLVLDCELVYDVRLGTTNPPTTVICVNSTEPSCAVDGLLPDTTYYWQAIAKGCCGVRPGPIWSFKTCSNATEKPKLPRPIGSGVSVFTDLSWNANDGCAVSPADRTRAEGDSANNFPFGTEQMRYQQIYAAAGIPQSGTITEIRFRPDDTFGSAFDSTDIVCDIYLGYASGRVSDPSETFTENIGPGRTLVFSGTMSLSNSNIGGPPHNFDIVLDIYDTFFYDNQAGDLLLDIFVYSGSLLVNSLDAHGFVTPQAATTRIYGFDVNGASGTVNLDGPFQDPYGLVTMFCFDGSRPIFSSLDAPESASDNSSSFEFDAETGVPVGISAATERAAPGAAGSGRGGRTVGNGPADSAAILYGASQEIQLLDIEPGVWPLGEPSSVAAATGAVPLVFPDDAVLIDFDDIPGGSGARFWHGDRYLNRGVRFSTSAGSLLGAYDGSAAETSPTFVYGSVAGAGANDKVIATFTQPAGYVSFFVADGGTPDQDFHIRLYDLGGTLLEDLTSNANDQFFEFAYPDIARVEFTPSGDYEALDSFRFVSPVNECVDLGHPTLSSFTDSFLFNDRSVADDMSQTIEVRSLGLSAQFAQTTDLIVNIYELNGADRGLLLATASRPVSPAGLTFWDVPIDFVFQGGRRYEIAFTIPGGWGTPSVHSIAFYSFQNSTLDPALGYDVGPFKVLDGANDGSFSGNTWMPHIRACVSSSCFNILYDVYFDTIYPPRQLLCASTPELSCALPGTLASCTTYYWQVVARDCCGQVAGDIWSFTTGLTGDLDLNRFVDYRDTVRIAAQWLQSGCSAANFWCLGTDLNRDGLTNVLDLNDQIASWLEQCFIADDQ